MIILKRFRELYFRSRWVTDIEFTLLPERNSKNIPKLWEATDSQNLNITLKNSDP